jgi:hypothetical protein
MRRRPVSIGAVLRKQPLLFVAAWLTGCDFHTDLGEFLNELDTQDFSSTKILPG